MKMEDILQGFRECKYPIKRKNSKIYYTNHPEVGVIASSIDGEPVRIPPMITLDTLLGEDWEIYLGDFKKCGVGKEQLEEGFVYKASHDGELYFRHEKYLYKLLYNNWLLYGKIELVKEEVRFIKLYKLEGGYF